MYLSAVKQHILNVKEQFTPVENSLADFFLHNTKQMDFSSKNLSKVLYVSEAALSRFAKKCGYKGYRELIFNYQNDLLQETDEPDVSKMAQDVHDRYWELLQHAFALLDEIQIARVAELMGGSRRVFVYGMGSSGFSAQEFQLRFMRLGLSVEAFTDPQMMRMNSAVLDAQDLVFGITLSGKTQEVLEGLNLAKANHARTILLTGLAHPSLDSEYDEVLALAAVKGLDTGAMISPQFPVLVIMDILYTYFLESDMSLKTQKHRDTLNALQRENRHHMN
ncbi:MAG TPA: MurR/RpiR family transcriptional regulator [Caproicibacter sp.]|nr:MurR/RpiR family transcriptional regulator [Caproicibacter sp.]